MLIFIKCLMALVDGGLVCQVYWTSYFLVKQVQGKDRLVVKYVAEQLGLDGSYIPRTYIEQIQLEKLVNEVMV